jgi:hypothetical protein
MSLSTLTTGILNNSDGIVQGLASFMSGMAKATNALTKGMGLPASTTAGRYNTEVGINAYGDGDIGTDTTTTANPASQPGAQPGIGAGPVAVNDPGVQSVLQELLNETKQQGKNTRRTQDLMNIAGG